MIEQIARAIAKADGADFDTDPARFRRLALAALKPLARPTEAMVDAAHQAVWFDAFWAINRWADFRKAVRAMIEAAIGRFPEIWIKATEAANVLTPSSQGIAYGILYPHTAGAMQPAARSSAGLAKAVVSQGRKSTP